MGRRRGEREGGIRGRSPALKIAADRSNIYINSSGRSLQIVLSE